MKQGKSNKIKVKMILAVYYKDEEDKTIKNSFKTYGKRIGKQVFK